MKSLIKYIFKIFGIILIKEKNYFNPQENLLKSIECLNVQSIIDVGAHEGNFIKEILKRFPLTGVVSFEPAKEPFSHLINTANKYKNWKTFNYALGSCDEIVEMNISNYTEANSLLNIEKRLVEFRPELKVLAKELVKCKTIDSFIEEFSALKKPILLKIDTQGYELEVLKKADQTINIVDFIFLEVSTSPVYSGQPSLKEILIYLENKNFKIWSTDRVMGNRSTGETFQINILFTRFSY